MWDRATGEPVHNAIVWQDTRTDAIVRELAATGLDRLRDATGLPLATYFAGPEDPLDPRQRRRRARARRGGRARVRDDGHLGRSGTSPAAGRGARHRRDQRVAHAADGPARRSTGTSRALELMGIPRAMLPEIQLVLARRTARRAGTAIGGTPIAGILGDQQAALFGQTCFDAGRRQEHLRHRLLPAGQHRRGGRRAREQLLTTRRLPARRRRRRRTRWRARSRSPARSSSGCATGCRSSTRAPEVEALAADRRRQRRRLLRARLLRACSPRTGATTPAA